MTCDNNNRWVARASGGVYFYTSSDLFTGVYLAAGSETWQQVSASDRSLKENFGSVDGQEILARLAEIPISTWNYKAADASARHMSPVAQDFYGAFGLGEDDKHLSALDTNGVALAAIQGLYQMVQEKDAQIANLEARVAALEAGAVNPVEAGFVPGGWPTLTILLTGLGLGWLARRGNALSLPKRGGR